MACAAPSTFSTEGLSLHRALSGRAVVLLVDSHAKWILTRIIRGRRTVGKVGIGRLLERVARYVREVRNEGRKVVWPTSRQTVTFTIVVIVAVGIIAGLIYGLDQLLNFLFQSLVGAA